MSKQLIESLNITDEELNNFVNSKDFATLCESEKMAVKSVLSNTAKEVKQKIMEGTLSGDIAQFTPILVPVMRRAFPKLIGTELVGTQALKMPTGYLYSLVPVYQGSKAKLTGTAGEADWTQALKGFNYTEPKKSVLLILKDSGDNYDQTLKNVTTTPSKVVDQASNFEGYIIYSEVVSAKDKLYAVICNVKTNTSGALKKGLELDKDTWAAAEFTVEGIFENEVMWKKILKHYAGLPMTTAEGEVYGANNEMREIGIEMKRVTAEAKTKKLKALYTLEMIQDLKAQHGIDAEKELQAIMSAEIAQEIDRSIIDKVNSLASVSSDFTELDMSQLSAQQVRWDIEKFRLLAARISNEAREIGRLTRKGGGNKLLVSPKVATALEQIGTFVISPTGSKVNAVESGVNPLIGKFDNRYDVIVDNFADFDYVTVAYKGSNYDAGAFFAPYNTTMSQVVDPLTGQPGLILMNRYDVVESPLHPEAFFRQFAVKFDTTILGSQGNI